MTRSHAHRAAPATVALVALALAGCGSAKEPAASTTATAAGTAASSAPAETPRASPSAAGGTGKDDPLTGIAGTQDQGICQWVTGEQVGSLAAKPVTGPLRGTITTNDTPDGKGKIRRCMTQTGTGARLILGTITFETAADLEKWFEAPAQATTPIDDLPQPAVFGVFTTPTGVSQSIQATEGTTLRYITGSFDGVKVKVVKGKNVPATDHRPALRALYDQLFG